MNVYNLYNIALKDFVPSVIHQKWNVPFNLVDIENKSVKILMGSIQLKLYQLELIFL